MSVKNTRESYGSIAKSFHWLIAVIVIGMLAVGLYMDSMDASPLKFKLYGWHKSIGFILIWLVALRLAWRLYNVQPAPHANHKPWERVLARIIHFLLYAGIILMPMSGWLMSSADSIPDPLVYGIDLPQIIEPNQDLKRLFGRIHYYTGWGLIGLIALHFSGAMKHHIIDKDSTLRRMLPFGKAE